MHHSNELVDNWPQNRAHNHDHNWYRMVWYRDLLGTQRVSGLMNPTSASRTVCHRARMVWPDRTAARSCNKIYRFDTLSSSGRLRRAVANSTADPQRAPNLEPPLSSKDGHIPALLQRARGAQPEVTFFLRVQLE